MNCLKISLARVSHINKFTVIRNRHPGISANSTNSKPQLFNTEKIFTKNMLLILSFFNVPDNICSCKAKPLQEKWYHFATAKSGHSQILKLLFISLSGCNFTKLNKPKIYLISLVTQTVLASDTHVAKILTYHVQNIP